MKPFSRSITLTSALATVGMGLIASNVHADDLKIVPPMLSISDSRFDNYWPTPTGKEQYNTWSWLPKAIFYLKGDMPPGAEVSIEYMLPDGRPWLTVPIPAQKQGDTDYYLFAHTYSTQEAGKRAKLLVGTFPYRIHLKNPLDGTNKVIYSGKYTVGKFHVGNALPQFKNQFEYYVDQDWRLPMAYVSPDYNGSYSDEPRLEIRLYLKGQVDEERLEGVLTYQGKVIGSKEIRSGTANSNFMLTTSGMGDTDPKWSLYSFVWSMILMHAPEANRSDEQWYLNEHPGEYEFKLLRNGQLTRSVKFTIDDKGNIPDNGLGAKANSGGISIVPVKVLGTADGKWNPLAWKTGMFYGNPLAGFAAP